MALAICVICAGQTLLLPAQVAVLQAQSACTLSVHTSRPVVLRDGRHVLVDARSAVANEGKVLLLGTPTIAWNERAGRSDEHFWGVSRDQLGFYDGVVAPTPSAELPRALSAGPGRGWHVLFVDHVAKNAARSVLFDSAVLWYARYLDGRWSDRVRIGLAANAILATGSTSALVSAGGELRFAYAFDATGRKAKALRSATGVVMVRLIPKNGSVRLLAPDTLYTWQEPAHVVLLENRDYARSTVLLAQNTFLAGRLYAQTLLTTTFTDRWSEPTRVLRDSIDNVIAPGALRVSGAEVYYWKAAPDLSGQATLRMIVRSDHERLQVSRKLADINVWDGVTAISLPNAQPGWLVRIAQDSVRALTATSSGVVNLGAISIPLSSNLLVATRLSTTRYLLLTGVTGTAATPMPALSVVSILNIVCGR